MRTAILAAAALFALGTTACLRGTGTDPDASSNGNNNGSNNNGSNNNGSNNNNGTPDADTGSNTGNPDASNTGNPDSGTMAGPPCKNKVSSYGTGHHNAGQDCMQCHGDFSLAGTLYTTATGSTIIAGAVITIKDANGQTEDLVTQANGNFYSTTAHSFPVTVYASECQISQTSQVMVSAVQASSNGGCNMSGCHRTTSQGHIHLP